MQLIEGEYGTTYEKIDLLHKVLLKRFELWKAFYRDAGSDFASAMKEHEDALVGAAVQAEKRAEMLSIVFAAVGVGTMSGLSSIVQIKYLAKHSVGKIVAEVIEDAAQSGYEEIVEKYSRPEEELSLFRAREEKIPLVYQNKYLNALTNAFSELSTSLTDLMGITAYKQKEARWNLAERATIPTVKREGHRLFGIKMMATKILSNIRASVIFGPIPKIPVPAFRDELERGIWSRWIPNLKYTIRKTYVHDPAYPGLGRDVSIETRYHSFLGDDVESRLNHLGITQEALGEPTFGFWTFESEVEKLCDWKWKPKIIIPQIGK